MQTWAVIYNPTSFSEELYAQALLCVDEDSRSRIKRFYHRADACRTLIGRLLLLIMLRQQGLGPRNALLQFTEAGKPYIVTTPPLDPPVGFNLSHDNGLIALSFSPGVYIPPAFGIGVDIMKVHIPGRETFISFVETMKDQLTPLEIRLLFLDVSEDEGLRRFFWMWTLKEAYTKALGLGLGFDFQRVEFDVLHRVVRIDGQIPMGWKFRMFTLSEGRSLYEGVVAEYCENAPTEVIDAVGPQPWLTVHDAVSFVRDAILQLTPKVI
ncbi:4'-phosphopantetheinyl transferase superfamily [Cyathus striatus]|nr:4'-phosphopantetheinyl transferase superfamily [Cyathus striatus]